MLYAIYFIYGLCVMFYFMMSWLFYRKDKEMLSRLVTVLMFVVGLQCLKDLFFIKPITELDEIDWMVVTAADMVVVPLYAFALIELCSPTSLTRRTIIFHELLFIVPFALLSFTRDVVFYYAMVLEAAVYGTSYFLWTAFAIPKYNAQLKQRFSYTENINLGWPSRHPLLVHLHSSYMDCRLHARKLCTRGSLYGLFAGDVDVHKLLHLQARVGA